MSIFSALTTSYSLEDAYKAKDCTTQEMRAAIAEWFRLYYEQAPTKDSDPSQRIAYTVVNKLTKTAFGEYKASSEDAFAASIMAALDLRKRKAMQLMLVGGEVFLKPYPVAAGWDIGVVSRDNVLVFGRGSDGAPTDIGTIERSVEGSKYYTLLERRSVGPDGRLTIRNKLYRSEIAGQVGQQVSLKSLGRYENLPEAYTYPAPLFGLGLTYAKTPMENIIDGSPDGVSVYAAAVGLIKDIDHNEALLNREFENGRSRVIASSDMFRRDKHGKFKMQDDLFVQMQGDIDKVGMTIFSPELREASFLARKREYLRNVESVIGIKRGLLSEVEAQERTAKEVTSSEGDYNLTIIDLQEVWSRAVKDTLRLCSILGKLYKVPGAHDIDPDTVTIDYGNGVLYDEERTWAGYLDMVARGMLKPEIALGWRFNMPTETPEDLAAIREKYMPNADGLTEEE